jgi:hypothetical protein
MKKGKSAMPLRKRMRLQNAAGASLLPISYQKNLQWLKLTYHPDANPALEEL